jgi:restriction endonuclease
VKELKMETKAIKKNPQTEIILRMEHLGKRTGTKDASITNRIQKMEERIVGLEDTIKKIDTPVKENVKSKKFLTQNIQKIWDTVKRPNLRIIGIEEGEESQL